MSIDGVSFKKVDYTRLENSTNKLNKALILVAEHIGLKNTVRVNTGKEEELRVT